MIKKIGIIIITILLISLSYGLFKWYKFEKVLVQVKTLFDSAISLNLETTKKLKSINSLKDIDKAIVIMRNLSLEFKKIHKRKKLLLKQYPYLNNRHKYTERYKVEIQAFLKSLNSLHLTLRDIPLAIKENKDFKLHWQAYSKIFLRF